jgi:hypothetical protein
VFLNGKRVRIIQVQPDLSQFGPRMGAAGRNDKLFRHTVVYLTCLHETGHVLALPHTDDFADVMYSFQYGGDVLEYFNQYRRPLRERSDIRAHSGISETDRKRVAALSRHCGFDLTAPVEVGYDCGVEQSGSSLGS